METKQENWLKKRSGRPTSSKAETLFKGGSRPATDEEIAIYKLVKSTRKTVDLEFGETAIEYLYELAYERESGQPTWTPSNRNFDWGSAQEPYAIKYLKANHPELDVKHCSGDDFPEIVFNVSACGLGDSPDFYSGTDVVGEIKCVMTGAKLKRIKEMTREEAMQEYRYQFAGHLIGSPWANKLIYLVYFGQNDDNQYDILDPLDPSRGIIFEYDRSEFTDLINKIEAKVTKVMAFLALVDEGKYKVRDINNWTYEQ